MKPTTPPDPEPTRAPQQPQAEPGPATPATDRTERLRRKLRQARRRDDLVWGCFFLGAGVLFQLHLLGIPAARLLLRLWPLGLLALGVWLLARPGKPRP